MSRIRKTYKYCIVPQCKNTSKSTPEKLFFSVPRDPKIRKEWCSVFNTLKNVKYYSNLTSRYCCEDHFDLETDMESYIKYKLVGGNLILKKGVLPHKFDCWKSDAEKYKERKALIKRQTIELWKRVLDPNICHENLVPDEEFVACGIEQPTCSEPEPLEVDPLHDIDTPIPIPTETKKTFKSVGVQVNIKKKCRSKSVNCNMSDDETVPKKKTKKRRGRKPRKTSDYNLSL